MSSPLDEALALVEEKPKILKTEYSPDQEIEAHRIAQRTHMLQWTNPVPDPVSVSFNRRTAKFVGLAIRQMAKQAYDQEIDSDGDSEGHTANHVNSFEAIMSRQTEVRCIGHSYLGFITDYLLMSKGTCLPITQS